ncbi:MAG: polar amino acid ABC transporter permease [Candidatus Adiutrix intracellularis]|nr:MAG: polar amino acid ABC transporter permease [Candidatus Adiutrix intracellularis]MDR2826546.1 amino acid ABC transporter permease [Candidatus Adiutrix intracellularis]
MDLFFFAQYMPMYLKAAGLTVTLAAAGIGLSVVLGLICALVRFYRLPLLRPLASIYIEFARNTPLMIQLFFLYYALPKVYLKLEGISCAIIGLAFLGGGYMAEAFRGGLEAVSRTQIEAGLSMGLTRLQLIRYVILPQAFAVAAPALAANTIFLIKETSVFSIVALADLVYVFKDLIKEGHSTENNLLLIGFYLVIILPVSLLFSLWERRLRRVGFSV